MKDYGFRLDPPNPNDYHFGGFTKLKGVPLTNGDWTQWLPEKETQLATNGDSFACVSFGTTNCIEILFKQKYGNYENFSDRFTAIVSGTKIGEGNTPNNVIESIRKVGLINELFLPFNPSMSLETFYSPVPMTKNYIDLASKFLDKWKVGHEWVDDNPESIKEALKCSPLGVSVEAWYEDQGKYVFPSNNRNHWVCLFNFKEGEYWLIYDSAEKDIKRVAWDSKFYSIKRYWIEPNNDLSIMKKILDLIGRILNINALQIKQMQKDFTPVVPEPTPPITPKPVEPAKNRIPEFAKALQTAEGYHEGSRSFRNNNPGNIKFAPLIKELGATGKDKDGFATFPTYEAGFKCLCDFLTLACQDKLAPYHKSRTLRQFCKVYALPPNDGYALLIASKLGIDPDSDISTLL